jgi:hypothetical protein
MLRLFLRLMLVVGIGMTGAACLDDGYAAPRGYYQPAPGYTTYRDDVVQQQVVCGSQYYDGYRIYNDFPALLAGMTQFARPTALVPKL